MKKIIYITCFTVLGVLLAALLHGAIELPLLWLMTGDIERWGDSVLWQNWQFLHRYVGGAIWLLGLGGGVWGGFRYWRILYVEQRYGQPRF